MKDAEIKDKGSEEMKKGSKIWLLWLLVSLLLIGGCSSQEEEYEVKPKKITETEDSTENSSGTSQNDKVSKDDESIGNDERVSVGEAAGDDKEVYEEEVLRKTAPVIAQTFLEDNRFGEDGTLLVEGSFQALEVSGEGYEAVSASVSSWFAQKEDGFREIRDSYEEYASEVLTDGVHFYPYASTVSCSSPRADGSVISLKCSFYEYSGGAHGNYGSEGAVFDVSSGEQISFWELTSDREAFSKRTLDGVLQKAVEGYADGLFPDYEDTIRSIWQEEPNWYLDAAGITVIFQPYEIGPYAMGEVYITLPYGEYEDLLKPQYLMGKHAGVSVITEGVEAQVSLGMTSEERTTICLYAETSGSTENTPGPSRYLLEVGEQTEVVGQYERLGSIHLLQREDGRSFLMFDGDMASDDYLTYVYEITDGQIMKTYESGDFATVRQGTVTLQGMQLGVRVDALGTYTAYGDYVLTQEGTLEQAGQWYTIDTVYDSQVLTTVQELPVTADNGDTVLPAGSRLRIIGTDGQSIMRYRLENSVEEGEIHFTRGEENWQIIINGVNETEYFEELPYAG